MPMLAQQGNQLAKRFIPLVHQVAGQVARRLPAHVRLEDLVAAGMLGLAGALRRYDPHRAASFKGYAEFRIRGEIIDELRRRDFMSRDARAQSKRIEKAVDSLRQERGSEPDSDEIAAHLGMSLEMLQEKSWRAHDARQVSLADVQLPDNRFESPDVGAQRAETRGLLAEAIETLPERWRVVLWLYYYEELPLQEIGELLGVTPSRICQIRADAVSRLQERMTAAAA